MWSSIVIVLAATMMQVHRYPISAMHLYNNKCVTPNGKHGYCQTIRSCESLTELLQTNGSAEVSVKSYISDSICDYVGKGALVCCPISDIRIGGDDHNNNNNNNNNNHSKYGPLLIPQCGNMVFLPVPPVIAGGKRSRLGNWPWIAALGYRGIYNRKKPDWLCGGSLISSRHVLTAGHCVYKRDDLFLVRLGELDLDERNDDGASPIDVFIEKRTIHSQYSPSSFTNDIALLRLEQDVQFSNYIRPICLPIIDELIGKDFVDTFPFLVGWGITYFNGPRSSMLQEVQAPVVRLEECKEAYKYFKNVTLDDRIFCAGYTRGGKGTCQGDSGGPVMHLVDGSFYVIGIVSYGFKCAEPGFPAVYSKTTSFLNFILPLLN